MTDSMEHHAERFLGSSAALGDVRKQLRSVATTDATVLVQGETGTGKELIARELHHLSARCGPFVKVNCAAIPRGLLESELLGHEKGAFTGASARRIGRFELAQDGTILLDEIGELAIDLQPKLLRVLQEREFERVGGVRTLHTNARIITATNRDLATMVDSGTFREDLYYRLCVFPIQLPPLRERRDDIPALVEHYACRLAARMHKRTPTIPDCVMARLVAYAWPGNIRELQNVLERALILSDGHALEIPRLATPSACTSVRSDHLCDVNRAHILSVLEASRWVLAGPAGAAARLGMKRSTLCYRMKKLGIARPQA